MESSTCRPSFISVGASRQPSGSAWDKDSGLLAFSAHRSIAIWEPESTIVPAVTTTLKAHTDKVNTVRFLPCRGQALPVLLSGSIDKTLRIWRKISHSSTHFDVVAVGEHDGSVNDVAAIPVHGEEGSYLVAAVSANGSAKIWKLSKVDDGPALECLQTITTKPRFFPIAAAITTVDKGYMLAIAGSTTSIDIHIASSTKDNFEYAATLTGHENWVRCLVFTQEPATGDTLLASASQDRFIRLWRIHKGKDLPAQSFGSGDLIMGKTLSNKAHRFLLDEEDYTVTFEALLVGHEDWVYTADWQTTKDGKLQLLTSSADNSLSIWETEETSGIWTGIARLGEISTSKGSSTATGSAGGFWTGLWSPDGNSVVSLAKTGSWRKWAYVAEDDVWEQQVSIGGHVRDVTGIAWGDDGDFLLSTSLDQTTRLLAPYSHSWYEFSRAQIHGYDINCISTLGSAQFVTGADEKLLRVFDQPKSIANLLSSVCNIHQSETSISSMPDAASVPLLSLSNKAIKPSNDENDDNGDNQENEMPTSNPTTDSIGTLTHPPLEDQLARHTLWPEHEKLYGHGYEISTLATSHHAPYVIATACRASSIDHAVIRIFEAKQWRQIKPPLTFHSLTVTKMAFSPDDIYLLSVGRDRQFAVFKRGQEEGKKQEYALCNAMVKGHTRLIWDGKWAPVHAGRVLATASRDKTVKIWRLDEVMPNGATTDGDNAATNDTPANINAEAAPPVPACTNLHTIKFAEPVTAIDFYPLQIPSSLSPSPQTVDENTILLAIGTESGALFVYKSDTTDLSTWTLIHELSHRQTPDKSITEISWRPKGAVVKTRGVGEDILKTSGVVGGGQADDADVILQGGSSGGGQGTSVLVQFAVGSEDSSVRIYDFFL